MKKEGVVMLIVVCSFRYTTSKFEFSYMKMTRNLTGLNLTVLVLSMQIYMNATSHGNIFHRFLLCKRL